MEQELNLTRSQRGAGRARADIVVWASAEDKQNSKSPMIIVECKAQIITIKEADYFQGQNYAYFSGAKFFVTTNEKETKYFQVKHGEFPKHLGNEIIAIPKAEDLIIQMQRFKFRDALISLDILRKDLLSGGEQSEEAQ